MDAITDQTLHQAVEELLSGASFNFDEGNTRQLIANVRQQLAEHRRSSTPATFYYDVQSGTMKKSRRAGPRPRPPH
jgi:hypothetical protein